MNKYGVRIAACVLLGTLTLSGYHMTLEAKLNSSATVPAAGIAVALNEGSTIQELQADVVQNIAYLESASGLQHNIILASEKVARADMPVNALRTNTQSGAVSLEVIKEKEEASENGTEVLSEEISTEIFTDEYSTEVFTEEKTTEVFTDIEEIGETEQISTEQEEQSETTIENSTEETSSVVETEETEETEETTAVETEVSEETEANLEAVTDIIVSSNQKNISAKEVKSVEKIEEKEDEQDFSGLVIAQVSNYVNVRSMPSEEGEIVGKLYDKSVGEFIEEKDGWYKIKSGNCTGYVKGEYCVVGEEAEALAKEVGTTYAIVNTTTLKVRQEASTESSVLGLVPIEEELVVVEELDGWVKIAIEEGDGYVSREYVSLRTDFVHAESKEEEEARLAKEAKAREEARAAAAATEAARAQQNAEKAEANQAVIAAAQNTAASSEGSEMGKAVIDYATQFVGNPYVYGGSSLTNGTDCSGFVMSVYANFGVGLPHSSSALRSKGYDVGGLENAQPGDIVCYSGHVGLYVGNGQIVHASTSKTGIIVSNASYRKILAVRRIF